MTTPVEPETKEDLRKVTVDGMFGKPVKVNRERFVSAWTEHAYQLTHLGIGVVEETRKRAESLFEMTYREQNPEPVDNSK